MTFFLAFTIAQVTSSFVLLGLMLFVEYTKLEEVESYFSQNEKVLSNKRFWRRNQWIDRQYRMMLMFDFLQDSKRHVKAGVVTEAELASVPLALRRWVVWPYYFGFVWLIALVVWSVWRRGCDIPIS